MEKKNFNVILQNQIGLYDIDQSLKCMIKFSSDYQISENYLLNYI